MNFTYCPRPPQTRRYTKALLEHISQDSCNQRSDKLFPNKKQIMKCEIIFRKLHRSVTTAQKQLFEGNITLCDTNLRSTRSEINVKYLTFPRLLRNHEIAQVTRKERLGWRILSEAGATKRLSQNFETTSFKHIIRSHHGSSEEGTWILERIHPLAPKPLGFLEAF